MDIARKKRKENIAEYILYLWQLEDILRALELDQDKIYDSLVRPRADLTPQQQYDLFLWYMEMVNLLVAEHKTKHGHLDHSMHLVDDLNDLHTQLLSLPVGEKYRTLYYALAPELPELKARMDKPGISDIEICFRALYSVVLYRLKGQENPATEGVLALVSPVISELSGIFHKIETGELDLYKKE